MTTNDADEQKLILGYMKKASIFLDSPPEILKFLMERVTLRDVREDELVDTSKRFNFVCVACSGMISDVVRNPIIMKVGSARFKPGDIFNVESLAPGVDCHFFVALEKSLIAQIRVEDFERILLRDGTVGARLVKMLLRQIDQAGR